MPTISLTLPVSGNVVTAGLHATNYTSIQSLVNGGLDTANWASGKIFAPSKFVQEGATDKQFIQWNNGGALWQPAGDYAAYTPTLTGSTSGGSLGNGVVDSRFLQIGKLVHCYGTLTWGSTTSGGVGNLQVSLPVSAKSNVVTDAVTLGQVIVFDSSAGALGIVSAFPATASVFNIQYPSTWPTSTTITAVTGAVPWTWATNDTIRWNLVYEAA